MFSLATLALLPAAFAVPWGPPHSYGPPAGPGANSLYFLENNPAGSAIVAVSIGRDGMISDPVRTSTHGLGSFELNATTGAPVTEDTMGGQDAVVVSGNLLFTVNAGSDTAVMFSIDPKDPSHLTMIGEPASTVGEFPISVAYSPKLRTACVVTTGAVAGVQCYHANPKYGLKPTGPFREFPKAVVDQTTPPAGPPGEAADIFFKPDSSALLVSVKGGTGTPPSAGYIVGYPVSRGVVSTKAVLFQNPNLVVAFGSSWTSETDLLVSDAAAGSVLLNVAEDLTITEISNTTIPGQMASCWADYDAALEQGYVIDAALPYMYLIDPSTGALEGQIDVEESLGGLFDSAILGQKMYLLTAVNGIVVIDLEKKEQAQFLNLTGFSDRQYYQGMAIFSGHAHGFPWW